ncbi:MAG: serine hydrolase, partial [Betaproteobacteria bacterium]|nr:serine hydrolase [Betaproteobacteria bacterium]
VIANLAQGYSMDAGRAVPAQYLDMSVPYAGGSLYASTHDLHRWNRLLYGDTRTGHAKPGVILTRESLAQMLDPGRRRYGLGIGIDRTPYGTRYAHTGGMPGVNTVLHYEPATALTVVVLANNDAVNAEALAQVIGRYARDRDLKLAHQHTYLAGDQGEAGRAILGRYSDGAHRAGQVTLIDGAPHIVPDGNPEARLFAVGPLHYVAPATLSDFVFARDANGRIVSLETHLGGERVTLKREPAVNPGAQDLWLRGSMNDWGTTHKFISTLPKTWTTRVRLEPGAHQFKIATADWRTIDLGAPSQTRDDVIPGRALPLKVRGANLRLWLDDPESVEFRLDVTNPEVPVLTVSTAMRVDVSAR